MSTDCSICVRIFSWLSGERPLMVTVKRSASFRVTVTVWLWVSSSPNVVPSSPSVLVSPSVFVPSSVSATFRMSSTSAEPHESGSSSDSPDSAGISLSSGVGRSSPASRSEDSSASSDFVVSAGSMVSAGSAVSADSDLSSFVGDAIASDCSTSVPTCGTSAKFSASACAAVSSETSGIGGAVSTAVEPASAADGSFSAAI